MTKFQLLTAFAMGLPLAVKDSQGKLYQFAIVNMIEREDGSNHSYNIRGVLTDKTHATVHFRTLD